MAEQTITVQGLIEDADKKIRAREQLVEQIAGVREMLRYLDKAGQTSKEQKDWIAKAFPPRERKPKDENGTAAAE